MVMPGKLFLLGGSAAREAADDVFVPEAGGADGAIALLLSGQPGWEAYVPGYVEPWERRGIAHVHVVAPGADGALDGEAAEALRRATGIFVGGGDTAVYQRVYATEPVRGLIRERVAAGVPCAGLSAGALLAPHICPLWADEENDAPARIAEGLGLVADLVVGVHFTARNGLPGVLDVMARTQTAVGLGIDDGACAVLEEGRLAHVLGEGVHRIEMTDFESGDHRVTRVG